MLTAIAEGTLIIHKMLDAIDLLASEDFGEASFNTTIQNIRDGIHSGDSAKEVEKLYKALDD
jgi:hypothetical protein